MDFNKLKFNLTTKYPALRRVLEWNDGLIRVPQKPTDYVFGFNPSNKQVLVPDSRWTPYYPPFERQSNRYFDTMSCVTFSFLNALEMILKKKYSEDINLSDRFTAKASGTSRTGNSMENVYQSVRKTHGAVLESDYSFTDDMTYSEYFKPLVKSLLEKGKIFLGEWEITIEDVPQNVRVMQQALQYSPLWVSGYAWYQQGGLYRSYGRANHCFVIGDIIEGSHFEALDHYPDFIKRLAPDYLFGDIKILVVNKRPSVRELELKKLKDRGIEFVMRPMSHGEMYKITDDGLEFVSNQELIDMALNEQVAKNKMIGITEDLYNKLT